MGNMFGMYIEYRQGGHAVPARIRRGQGGTFKQSLDVDEIRLPASGGGRQTRPTEDG